MAGFGLVNSSVARKYWMALTGLFLCLFLVGHLFGNLQLLSPDIQEARDHFNEYAKFMATSPIIKLLSYLTYASVILHAIDGVLLTLRNRKARSHKYVYYKENTSSTWSSRNMGILGSVLFIFIVLHMKMFWAKAKFGGLNDTVYATANSEIVEDLYTLTVKSFQEGFAGLVWTLLYVVSMAALGFHLLHGFSSGFKSLGVSQAKYGKSIRFVGMVFAIAVPVMFAIIPIYIRFILRKV